MQVRSNDFKVAFNHYLHTGTPATSISCYRGPSLSSHITARRLEQPTTNTVESRTMDAIPGAFDAGDNGSGIMAAINIFIILATIAVGLRIVSRRMQRLALEADDFLIFAALVSRKAQNTIRGNGKSGGLAFETSLLDGQCVSAL